MASVEKEESDDNADDLQAGEGQQDKSQLQGGQGGAVSLKSGFESSDEFADYPGRTKTSEHCSRKHGAFFFNICRSLPHVNLR